MKQQMQRPRLNSKTKEKIGFFAKVRAVIVAAIESEKVVNKNKVYSQYGIAIGSPIFTPKHTKFKGYMRDSNYKSKRA